jgi:hypothetical protein
MKKAGSSIRSSAAPQRFWRNLGAGGRSGIKPLNSTESWFPGL